MLYIQCLFVGLFLALDCSARILERSGKRLKSRFNFGKVEPDLSSTESQLNQLEGTIRSWPQASQAVAGVPINQTGFTLSGLIGSNSSSGAFSNSSSGIDSVNSVGFENSTSGSSSVDNLTQQLASLENQSNNNIAQISGGVANNEILIDLVRVNMSRLTTEVRRNITRLKSAIDELGASSVTGHDSNFRSIAGQTEDLQAQINQIQTTLSSIPQVDDRINSLGGGVQALESRVSALENYASNSSKALAQSDESTSSSTSGDSSGSILSSWSGRASLLGLGLAIIALSLSIVTFLRLPPKPASEEPAPPEGEEQVLLEAGEGQEGEEVVEGEGEEVDQTEQGQEQEQ